MNRLHMVWGSIAAWGSSYFHSSAHSSPLWKYFFTDGPTFSFRVGNSLEREISCQTNVVNQICWNMFEWNIFSVFLFLSPINSDVEDIFSRIKGAALIFHPSLISSLIPSSPYRKYMEIDESFAHGVRVNCSMRVKLCSLIKYLLTDGPASILWVSSADCPLHPLPHPLIPSSKIYENKWIVCTWCEGQ